MKVSNWDFRPNHTYSLRKMRQDAGTAMLALEHPRSMEALAVINSPIKFNPAPIKLSSYAELAAMPPPYEQGPKSVSSWAWLTGDNPFLIFTVGGSFLPLPDRPTAPTSYQDAKNIYDEATQAALQFRGHARARATGDWAISTIVQLVLAGVCAIAALVVALVLLPGIIDRFQ